MAKNVKEFIANNVEKKLIKRDLLISESINAAYLDPLAKAWNEYGIGKQEIIFLSIIIAYKYTDKIKENTFSDCETVVKTRKTSDMGRLSDFSEEKLTFLISILISKYGIDKVINNIDEIWEDLRVMAEQGIKILYCKIYKEKTISTEIFNMLFNLDEELEI
ncbi:MAG TPA: hypothetical protein HA282_03310 [Nanoarchaeota archaeon]|nr:hypothetical protein [Candidatus Pacearchaeota archaeon]HIH18041.1 hypothetical protein [Nanoarchaeota archaeon]HIH34759.1 hypothetical protein [Nanoarchaeota archaeon]HIH51362.1 hypothetical protein [Nanoarchaeota archaeon]HIH66217.1 hypothetical protein [Nanoarchaeota archaeon]